eukprot:TRINITY_DN27567_c0_g1_i1.p1 TRINITY_DN27567_c0_g1~~TRINITY_DN27567_c0_g1_i1.p1  ORF type:complete len:419 (+),score=197.90 TRINITY_DN27567_c0_g1_i1:105-1361(+)
MADAKDNAPVKDHTAATGFAGEPPAEAGAQGPLHVEDKNVKKLPTVVLVVGMAGSGKTRFMHRMNIEMHQKQIPSFFVNLDPAVLDVPYGVNIDIRDTVNHKEVMKQYKLGPNGAIITSLNLFATRFDQVLGYIEQRQDELDYVFIDTPGQIEVFTWSASGQIIMETLASTFPTVVCYVVDAAKSQNPATFMSNMTYSCGILYRTQLPLLLCMNKIDIADHKMLMGWMQDVDAFRDALQDESSYSAQLTQSMAVMLQEFYANLRCAGMSAVTGEGVEDFMRELKDCRSDYNEIFLPELKKKMARKRERNAQKEADDLHKLAADIDATEGFKIVAGRGAEVGDVTGGEDAPDSDSDPDGEYEFKPTTRTEEAEHYDAMNPAPTYMLRQQGLEEEEQTAEEAAAHQAFLSQFVTQGNAAK